MSQIIIRKAQPKDQEQALPLVYSSGPEAFEYLFTLGNRGAKDFLRYCWQTDYGLFSHTAHYVADLDGQIVGSVSLYDRAEAKRWADEVTPQVIKFYGLRTILMLRRLLASAKWMVAPKANELYLANLGVRPECWGQGLGNQLLDFGKQLAKEKKLEVLCLDVADINPRAEALYTRFGMRVTGERPFPNAGYAVPKARRMVMNVNSSE